jgi:hypothetical protein
MIQKPKTEAYNIISFICFLTVVTPILLILYWGTGVRSVSTYPGMTRLEVGKLYIKNKQTAEQNPINQSVLLAERLNRVVAELAIQSPGNANRIRSSSPEMISETIQELSTTPPLELLQKAKARSIKWSPSSGSHGLFILDFERKPSKDPSFGAIELPGGKEKSTFETEKKLNKLLYLLPNDSGESEITPSSVISDALRTRPPLVTPEEAVKLIGLSYGLNISYNKDHNLFLSKESEQEIIPWQLEIKKIK